MTSRPPAVWLLLLAAVLGRIREGRGFSNGSVASSCETLLPGHHPYSASTLASPYTVSASASTYRPGDSITGTSLVLHWYLTGTSVHQVPQYITYLTGRSLVPRWYISKSLVHHWYLSTSRTSMVL